MKNITKKLVASLLSVGILLSGFSPVQAEETTQAEEVNIGTVTYEMYHKENGVTSVIANPNSQGGMADYHYKGLANNNLSEGEYTFAVYMDLTKSAFIPFGDDPFWFRDSYIYFPENQSYATVEKAQAAAREYAENWINDNAQTAYANAYNVSYVFFDPIPVGNQGNAYAYAYGHDKANETGQTVEKPVVQVTYDIWDKNGTIYKDSLINQWILDGFHYDMWTESIPEGGYGFMIVLLNDTNDDHFNVSTMGSHHPGFPFEPYATPEEAKAAAMEQINFMVNYDSSYNKYRYEFVDREDIKGNANANGHDNRKTQGLAVGHENAEL